MSQFRKEFKLFFESEPGQALLTSINNLIDSNHQKAENTPDASRDYMQRAKGNREVLDNIATTLSGSKKD